MDAPNHRVAIVTGGAQGIGRGIAETLLGRGMVVVIGDRDESAAREWLDDMGRPDRLHAVTTDVSDEAQVRRLIDEAVLLGGRLDALVNNVSIGINKPIEQLALDEWNRVLATNLTSVFLTAKHAAKPLRQTRGAIVNISSTRAIQSEANTEAYTASKGGIVSLTHGLAVSLGPEVRVNAICPGWIEVGDWQKTTNRRQPNHSDADRAQHPAGRVGTPKDIASLTAFLLSDEAGFITGQSFAVDGGMTIKMSYV